MPKRSSRKIRRRKKSLINQVILRNILGILFVILGFLFLYKVPIPQKTLSSKEPIKMSFTAGQKESTPQRIIIPNRDIDLSVTFSKIKSGYWEISETTASHGEGSANPGERGNIVIFAHARVGLFYNLRDIKKDDIIYVFTKDRWYRYKVSEIKAVYPNQVKTIAPQNHEVLTLFTCSGFFDEKRLIVKALPVN
jgi:LPXTG-site transpeptidase (sortase) family protein